MPTDLADAHIEQQARLRDRAVQAIAAYWAAQASYNEPDAQQWAAQAAVIVAAVQLASITLVDAFVAATIGRAPLGINGQEIISQLRGGVPPTETYRRPFVTTWTALKNGSTYEDAVHAGQARAEATAAMDAQLAHIGAYQAVQDADPKIKGYRRRADTGACAFCRLVDGAFVKRADASPLHNRCGCGLEPWLEDVTATPLPEGVAVHTHGELGPVLAAPEHSFTSSADL